MVPSGGKTVYTFMGRMRDSDEKILTALSGYFDCAEGIITKVNYVDDFGVSNKLLSGTFERAFTEPDMSFSMYLQYTNSDKFKTLRFNSAKVENKVKFKPRKVDEKCFEGHYTAEGAKDSNSGKIELNVKEQYSFS